MEKLDRKELKQPDDFQNAVGSAVHVIEKNKMAFIVSLLFLLVIGLSIVGMTTYKEKKQRMAADAYFKVKTELKGITVSANDDPDVVLKNQIDTLVKVTNDYSNTRASFEALIELGGIYFDKKVEKAEEFYKKAQANADDDLSKAIAYNNLAYVYEKKASYKDAIEMLNKAMALGETNLRPEILLNLARNYKLANDSNKAKETYEKVINSYRDTEQAKLAISYKNEIK